LIDEEYFDGNNEHESEEEVEDIVNGNAVKRRESTGSEDKNDAKSENKVLLPGTPILRRNEEQKDVGSVGIGTYFQYFKSGGSYIAIVLLLVAFILTQALLNFIDYWLSLW